ncbi:contractile injection system protein, VgrG/Pvc8 family [Stenotrophomonas rhizophila]|uniref:contractile injection system protein, VgrG/Pvc8 family n=1 Tax=Stenotrophomonas rhizophila TaxID=216778 RepID=UPI003D0E61C1
MQSHCSPVSPVSPGWTAPAVRTAWHWPTVRRCWSSAGAGTKSCPRVSSGGWTCWPTTPCSTWTRGLVWPRRCPRGRLGGHDVLRSGVVSEAACVAADGGLARYRLCLVPWTWLLGQARQSRVIQERTVLDILQTLARLDVKSPTEQT